MKIDRGTTGSTFVCIAIVALTRMASAEPSDSSTTSLPTVDADGYGLTPFGRYHQSCAHHVPQGAHVSDGAVRRADGSVIETIEPCAYPARDKPELGRHTSSNGPLPTINDWVETVDAVGITSTAGSTYFDWLGSRWTVPPAPTNYVGQTVFLFPALEPQSRSAIIQPVLQYGPSMAGGGNYWSYASWYIDSSGHPIWSTLYTTVPGHLMMGTMDASSCSAGVCYWSIETTDFDYYPNAPNPSQLNTWTSEVFDWAWATVLEVYNVSSCSQLPNTSSLPSSFIYLYEPGSYLGYYYDQDVTASVSWGNTYTGAGLTPGCSYSQSGVTSNTATIWF